MPKKKILAAGVQVAGGVRLEPALVPFAMVSGTACSYYISGDHSLQAWLFCPLVH